MDRLDESARVAGAVNTIVIRNRRMTGHNTDGIGFRRALAELGWRGGPTRAVVLGAGGAARAIAWGLTRDAGSCVVIATRHPERARRLARWIAARRPRACVCATSLARVSLAEAELVVNATTVGMRAGDPAVIDPRRLRRGTLVYDLVYHRATPLVEAARRRGCVAANGVSMLLYQGAESLRLWLRHRPPVEIMRRALL